MTESPNSTPDEIQEIHFVLETKFAKNNYMATWRVTNFGLCQYSAGTFIQSNTFTTNFGGTKKEWYLKMYPFGIFDQYRGYVSLYVCCKSECTGSLKLAILDQTNAEKCVVRGDNLKFTIDDSGGSGPFVKREKLFEENSRLLVNGTLTVLCVITMTEVENVNNLTAIIAKSRKTTGQLSRDLGDLLKSSRLTDLTITAGDRKFQAHRAILAARSPVFSAMFEHNLKENCSGTVDVQDIDPETMEALLNFIYTGVCPDVAKVAEDLLQISDKYQLDDLKEICSNYLLVRITSDNAASLLALADFCNAQDLKENVLRYITSNLQAVAISEGWSRLTATNPSLAIEVQAQIIECVVLKK